MQTSYGVWDHHVYSVNERRREYQNVTIVRDALLKLATRGAQP